MKKLTKAIFVSSLAREGRDLVASAFAHGAAVDKKNAKDAKRGKR